MENKMFVLFFYFYFLKIFIRDPEFLNIPILKQPEHSDQGLVFSNKFFFKKRKRCKQKNEKELNYDVFIHAKIQIITYACV